MQQNPEFGDWILTPESSNIKSFRYAKNVKVLQVAFKNEQAYEFGNVLPKMFEAFKKAESKGKYFNQNFRNNKSIPYKKLE